LRILYVAHKWVGLSAAILLIVQAASGLVISFKYEVARFAQPAAMRVVPGRALASIDVVVARIRETFPRYSVDRWAAPMAADDPYVLRLRVTESQFPYDCCVLERSIPAISRRTFPDRRQRRGAPLTFPVIRQTAERKVLRADLTGKSSGGWRCTLDGLRLALLSSVMG
jgi:hypothetical protein